VRAGLEGKIEIDRQRAYAHLSGVHVLRHHQHELTRCWVAAERTAYRIKGRIAAKPEQARGIDRLIENLLPARVRLALAVRLVEQTDLDAATRLPAPALRSEARNSIFVRRANEELCLAVVLELRLAVAFALGGRLAGGERQEERAAGGNGKSALQGHVNLPC